MRVVSRNCTKDGWSEPFPHYFEACGFDEYNESESGDQVSVCPLCAPLLPPPEVVSGSGVQEAGGRVFPAEAETPGGMAGISAPQAAGMGTAVSRCDARRAGPPSTHSGRRSSRLLPELTTCPHVSWLLLWDTQPSGGPAAGGSWLGLVGGAPGLCSRLRGDCIAPQASMEHLMRVDTLQREEATRQWVGGLGRSQR